jgi:hypothetical protein
MRKKFTISKPRVRKSFELVCTDDDDWFYVIYEVESTRKKNVGMIIQADVEAWRRARKYIDWVEK